MYTKSLQLLARITALLLMSVWLSPSVQAATATFGYTGIGATHDTGDANYINAWQFRTSSIQSGTMLSLSVYIAGPVSAAPYNQFQGAIYADAGGTPGALITSSASSTIALNAWNTVALTAPLLPSTAYWLAYNTNGSGAAYNNVPLDGSGSGTGAWRAHTFGSWPTTFGAPQGGNNQQGSMYVTYSPSSSSGLDTTPPTVPTNVRASAVSSSQINLSWSASTDNVGVAGYRIYRSNTQMGTATSTSYPVTGLAPATAYSFTVAAYDAAGNVSTPSNIATANTLSLADTTPPTVALTAPAPGATIAGTITVSATAADNVGVVGVQIKLDGSNVGSEDTVAPYAVTWDSTTITNGTHTFTAVARDAAGNTATSQAVTIAVNNASPAPGTPLLLQQSDLVYLGAFLLPRGTSDQTSFSYGGTALAYNPAQNSLFIVGHDWYQLTAEVSIPTIVQSASLSVLQTATLLQPFTDATNGKITQTGGSNNHIGGHLVYQGRLYGTAYIYYDATGRQVVSHWVRPSTSLASGIASGLYQVSTLGAGLVSGYMTLIPPEWQSAFGGPALTGNCCIPIISRTSYGPAASVFDPAALGAATPVPDIPLVYYPSTHPTIGGWADSWNPSAGVLFNGTTVIRDILFPRGNRSVLFIGTQGVGTFCYGTGGASGGDCYDPDHASKGTHAYPYATMVWAYDANELVAAKQGQKQPWQVKPYATWSLTLPFGSPHIGGAAYDSATGNIYVSQQYGNGNDPVIHVFRTP